MKIKVKNIAQKRIESEKRHIAIYEMILTTLSKYEGKRLTLREYKKIISEIEALGFSNCTIRPEYSWTSLKFTDRSNSLNFMLFYNDKNAREGFTIDGFKKCNTWASVGAYERLEKTEESLKNGKAEKLQKAYDHLAKALEILDSDVLGSYHVPYTYEIDRAFGYKLEKVRD